MPLIARAMAKGDQRNCPMCGQLHPVEDYDRRLSLLELRGPGKITSSNIDRILDNGGKAFLIIEEKRDGEGLSQAQASCLAALSERVPAITVWLVQGTPQRLSISQIHGFTNNGIAYEPLTKTILTDVTYEDYQAAVYTWFAETDRFRRR